MTVLSLESYLLTLTLESYLLLVILVIACISLFLCLVNALLLFDVSKRITRLKKMSDLPFEEKVDITTGIRNIAGKYHIDSLVIAMPDGLVVASAGSNDPEGEAAHSSSLFTGALTRPDRDLWLLPLVHRGIPMIGIVRSQGTLKKVIISRITEEIQFLFGRAL